MTEIRDLESELSRFRLRLLAAAAFALLAFGLLGARLVHLQVFRHDELAMQAEANRIAVVPIVPNRGLIVDRHGVVLASNYSAYTLEITPSRVGSLESVIDELRAEGGTADTDDEQFGESTLGTRNFAGMHFGRKRLDRGEGFTDRRTELNRGR